MESQKSDQVSSVAAQKEQWRIHLKFIRQNIHPRPRQEASNLACEKLLSLIDQNKYTLSFASLETEIDLWPFNAILAERRRLVLLRMIRNEHSLYLIQEQYNLDKIIN